MSTLITVEDLTPSQTYYFTVTAYNTSKLESDPAPVVQYRVPDVAQSQSVTLLTFNQNVQVPEDGSVTVGLQAKQCTTTVWSSGTSTVTETESAPGLAFRITTPPSRGRLEGLPPNLVYRPFANYFGSDSFSYLAESDACSSVPAIVTIQVSAVNDPPTAVGGSATVVAGSSVSLTLAGSDPEGDNLSVTITRNCAQGTITGSGSLRTYTPAPTYSGTDSLEFVVSDGTTTSAPATILLTVQPPPNKAPVAIAQSLTTPQDSSLGIVLRGTDPDNDPIQYVISAPPAHGSLSGTPPSIVYRPSAGFSGSDFFDFTVGDGKATSQPARVQLSVTPVNQAPVAEATSLALDEDTTLSFVLKGRDPEGSALTFQIVSAPSRGQLSGTPPNLRYQPSPNANGTDSFRFTVSDGTLVSAPAEATITIRPINDPPTAAGGSATVVAGSSVSLTLAGSDPEGDNLSVTITRNCAQGTISGSGSLRTYTPAPTYSGTDSLEFVVSDGTTTSAPATILLTVQPPPNKAPVAIAQSLTTTQDGSLGIVLRGTDPDNDPIQYVLSTPPAHGSVSGTPPSIVYRPSSGFSGSDFFDFTVSDGKATSQPARVQVSVTAGNQPPVAEATSLALDEDTTLSFVLKGRDPEGSALTFQIVSAPSRGQLSGTPPNLRYQPSANTNGVDSFRFTVSDGTLVSAPAEATITIRPINDPPRAPNRSWRTREDVPFAITLAGTDADNDTLTVTITKKPTQGTLSGKAPAYTYTPSTNFSGSDAFAYTVSDANATSPEAVVSIVVAPVNDSPVAEGTTHSMPEDETVAFTLKATDADLDPLSYVIAKSPGNGTLSGTPPNLVYRPNKDFYGVDRLAFWATDGAANSAYTYVMFEVSPVNDRPTANAAEIQTAANGSVPVVLSGSDPEKSNLGFRITTAPRRGTLSGTPPNLVYTAANGFVGYDTIEFTVDDGQLVSSPAVVSLTVGTPSKSPTPQPDSLLVETAGTANLLLGGATSVAANDDMSGSVRIELATPPSHGTVTLAEDGTFVYRHDGGQDTEDSFTYVGIVDGIASQPTLVTVHVVQWAGIEREGENIILSLPTVPGLQYVLEANLVSPEAEADWQPVESWSSDVLTITEVPIATNADEQTRYFRFVASHANGVIRSRVVGWQRFSATVGNKIYQSPFQGAEAYRSSVASAGGNVVRLTATSLPTGQWNASEGAYSYILVVSGGTRWWPIQSNDSSSLSVDSRGEDLAGLLTPGTTVEVVRLATVADVFGTPNTPGYALAPGDFVDFVSGAGDVRTLECRRAADAGVAHYIRRSGGVAEPVDVSKVAFLPGQPIQVQKATGAGTMWFLGRVQSNPLTLLGVGN